MGDAMATHNNKTRRMAASEGAEQNGNRQRNWFEKIMSPLVIWAQSLLGFFDGAHESFASGKNTRFGDGKEHHTELRGGGVGLFNAEYAACPYTSYTLCMLCWLVYLYPMERSGKTLSAAYARC